MSALVLRAQVFATEAHAGQVRRYTGEPYVAHCLEVADIVRNSGSCTGSEQLAAALLHDTIEDTPVTYDDILGEFGYTVARYVDWLTDPEVAGNRATRKAAAREKLSRAPAPVQTVKLADLISNTRSIVEHDPKFAKVYLAEKRALLEVLTGGSPELYLLATELAKQ
jgi:(p)ppGpp synthase/HD superfamily hydrolase